MGEVDEESRLRIVHSLHVFGQKTFVLFAIMRTDGHEDESRNQRQQQQGEQHEPPRLVPMGTNDDAQRLDGGFALVVHRTYGKVVGARRHIGERHGVYSHGQTLPGLVVQPVFELHRLGTVQFLGGKIDGERMVLVVQGHLFGQIDGHRGHGMSVGERRRGHFAVGQGHCHDTHLPQFAVGTHTVRGEIGHAVVASKPHASLSVGHRGTFAELIALQAIAGVVVGHRPLVGIDLRKALVAAHPDAAVGGQLERSQRLAGQAVFGGKHLQCIAFVRNVQQAHARGEPKALVLVLGDVIDDGSLQVTNALEGWRLRIDALQTVVGAQPKRAVVGDKDTIDPLVDACVIDLVDAESLVGLLVVAIESVAHRAHPDASTDVALDVVCRGQGSRCSLHRMVGEGLCASIEARHTRTRTGHPDVAPCILVETGDDGGFLVVGHGLQLVVEAIEAVACRAQPDQTFRILEEGTDGATAHHVGIGDTIAEVAEGRIVGRNHQHTLLTHAQPGVPIAVDEVVGGVELIEPTVAHLDVLLRQHLLLAIVDVDGALLGKDVQTVLYRAYIIKV